MPKFACGLAERTAVQIGTADLHGSNSRWKFPDFRIEKMRCWGRSLSISSTAQLVRRFAEEIATDLLIFDRFPGHDGG
jgi:hypothetical protein